jgi:4'-phosphopantetheinyl transferase
MADFRNSINCSLHDREYAPSKNSMIKIYEFTIPENISDQREFIATKLRKILGLALNRPPETLEFLSKHKGKPILHPDQNILNISFNLSHSEKHVLIGIAIPQSKNISVEIGVDIQKKRPLKHALLKFAERFFHPSEFNALQLLPAEQQEALFFTYWTQKEALIKCWGGALGSHLNILTADYQTPSCRITSWNQAELFYAIAVNETQNESTS